MKCDVVVDLVYGDTGKGKITHSLLSKNKYTHVLRYNGGANAGHTIYHKKQKFVTHQLPAGLFYGVKSIIGCGCVVNPFLFLKELEDLQRLLYFDREMIKIANNAHVITEDHLKEELAEGKIGTTRQGIGPCYRDKYARVGIQIKDCTNPLLQRYKIDLLEELFRDADNTYILAEGAQGFGLDIEHGDYPFVTSSPCTVGAVLLNGIPFTAINEVYGTMKSYATYVGSKDFQPKDKVFDDIQLLGGEYGATTGRKRKCNWNDMGLIKKAVKVNGVSTVLVNKMDILKQLNVWKVYDVEGKMIDFQNEDEFKKYLQNSLKSWGVKQVIFSYNPHDI